MAVIGIDAGHARDIMLMLTDAHALISDLVLRGAEDADIGGVRDADVGGVLRPRSRVAAGP
jgi:hypothetical protein